MKKLIYILTIASLLYTETFAYNPFEILHQNLPDLTVSNIFQETNSENIDMTICNIGGSMDQTGDIALGIKNNNSGLSINTLVKYVKIASGDCTSYKVGSIRNLGIYSGGSYNLKGAVKLSYYKLEENSYNNSRTSDVYLSSSSYGTTNSNGYSSNQYYCNGRRYTFGNNDTSYYCNGTWYSRYNNSSYSNNYNNSDKYYCGGTRYSYNNSSDTSYYCNGTRYSRNNNGNNSSSYNQYYCNGKRYTYGTNDTSYYCNGTRYSRNNNSNNSGQYYCNGSRYNYGTNDTSYYCNGTRYSRNNNGNNYYDGYYCNGSWYSLKQSDTGYYCNGSWYSRYSNGNNNNYYNNNDRYYCNNTRYYFNTNDTSYYCNGTRYARYTNGVNYFYNNNVDLQIDVINSSYSNRRINAKICNKGGDMGRSYTVRTTFYSSTTGKNYTKEADLNLSANSCSYTDVYASYSDLGFYYSGNVSINARLEILNYSENNTDNNSVSNSIWIDY